MSNGWFSIIDRLRRALPHREVVAVLAAVRASRKKAVDKLAFKFLALTVARSGFRDWSA